MRRSIRSCALFVVSAYLFLLASVAWGAASTTTTISDSVNPSIYGQDVTISAQVTSGSGTPIGSVDFFAVYSFSPLNFTFLGNVPYSGGTVSITVSTILPVGSYILQAQFNATDPNAFAQSFQNLTQVVNQANTVTVLFSNQNPSGFGQSVTVTATASAVSPGSGTPTGNAVFTVDGAAAGTETLNGAGSASLVLDSLSIGSHTVTTTYSGDANFIGSSATTLTQVVVRGSSTTTLTSSLNPATAGQSVVLTAGVAISGEETPAGTISFFDNGAPIGTVALSGGSATLATSVLSVGTHTLTANYSGDNDFNSSAASIQQVVDKASSTTQITSSLNPSTYGQSVTFIANVTSVPSGPNPSGSVAFSIDGSQVATIPLVGLQAIYTTSGLTAAGHSVTATYSGDANINGNTSVLANGQTVLKASTITTVTSSQNPATFGQTIVFSASVDVVSPGLGTPTGTVTFLDTGNVLGTSTLSANGMAVFTSSSLGAANHYITARYNADTNFVASIGTLLGNPEVIGQSATTTSLSTACQTEFVENQPFTFVATVVGVAPTGTVNFFNGTTQVCSNVAVTSASASCTVDDLAVEGSSTESAFDLTATYNGDTNQMSSTSSALSITVLSAADVIFRTDFEAVSLTCPVE